MAPATGTRGKSPSPPRRTREESRAETRARLLRSAATVFAQRGFAGASVEEIAERAGFSRGAFYSNFDSKDDVFLALLDAQIEAEVHTLRDALADDASPEAVLELLLARGAARRREARETTLLWAEFWLHVVRHPDLAPKLAARQRAARTAVAEMIQSRCAQLGVALPVPADQLASVLLAVDDGLRLQEFLDPDAVPGDLRARALMLVFQALATDPAGARGGAPPRHLA